MSRSESSIPRSLVPVAAPNIEFGPLGKDEASSWREQHGLEGEVAASCTLASLYAQLEGRDPSEAVLIGFGD